MALNIEIYCGCLLVRRLAPLSKLVGPFFGSPALWVNLNLLCILIICKLCINTIQQLPVACFVSRQVANRQCV